MPLPSGQRLAGRSIPGAPGASVVDVLAAIALTPSAPVLVPELAGTAAGEVAGIRAAALAAASELPDRWIAVGAAAQDRMIESETRGTFAGYGVDLGVTLGPDARETASALPLCALFAGWLRGRVNPDGRVQVRVYSSTLGVDAAVVRGQALRAEIDRMPDPIGVLVVADGASTLTPAAPGGYDPESGPVQAALDDALAAADAAALMELSDAIVGRVAYQVLAGLVGTGRWSGRELARGAPYGVGYFVGVWTPPR